jgi:L-asparaginase II
VANGWPTETYLAVDHPLQQAIRATFERMTGETAEVAVDGCGAPLLSTSLTGLARAFSRLSRGGSGRGGRADDAARVAGAIRAHPEYVSGTRRDELTLLRAIPGAIGKAGAESCYVVALPDGRAFATKTDDGAARARPVVMAALLGRSGVTAEPGVDGDAVRRTGESPLLGGGRPVGKIRAVGLV